jgi:hypothetical protein
VQKLRCIAKNKTALVLIAITCLSCGGNGTGLKREINKGITGTAFNLVPTPNMSINLLSSQATNVTNLVGFLHTFPITFSKSVQYASNKYAIVSVFNPNALNQTLQAELRDNAGTSIGNFNLKQVVANGTGHLTVFTLYFHDAFIKQQCNT